MATVDIVDVPPARLGECPVWDGPNNALWWTDIDGRRIHRWDRAASAVHTYDFDGRVGSFALSADPNLIVVAKETDLVRYDTSTGQSSLWMSLEPSGVGNRLNDGRCDPKGRFVVGSMFEDTSANKTTGILHQIGTDVGQRVLRRSIGVSNGLAFDETRERMYWADSPTRQILVFDYDTDSGAVSEPRLFFDYGDLPGKPDGGCTDAEGGYWSACVHGGAIIRVDPAGILSERIELPVLHPTMPCFGGADLDEIYVTSIADEDRQGPDGAIVAVTGTGIRGLSEPRIVVF